MDSFDALKASLREYNEDELFYKAYYEAKTAQNPATLQQFLSGLNLKELLARCLLCPDLFDIYETYGIADGVIRAETYHMGLDYNIQIDKHNRYAPLFPHSHNFFEIFYILEGSIQHTINGETTSLPAGTLCFVSPFSTHSIGVFDNSLLLYIYIQKTTFDDMFFNILRKENVISDFFLENLHHTTTMSHMQFFLQDEELEHLLLSMLQEQMQKDSYTNRILNAILSLFFTKLCRKYGHTAQIFRNAASANRPETKLLSYINHNYKTVTLSSLAKFFHYSEKHCSRLIKKATGKTFSALLKELRLRRAETLLMRTTLSVQEISVSSRFAYANSFISLFKKEYGMTPGQFRNQ